MKYTYAYKTSDGTRHEATMAAESREAVFAELRKQGIKAIKVVAADGSKANGEIRGVRKRMVVLAILIAALIAGTAVFFIDRGAAVEGTGPESPALVALRVKAAAVSERHRAAMTLADGDAEKVKKAVEETRTEAREIFKDILVLLPDEKEREVAKSLYGELMIQVDVSAAK